MYQRVQIIVNPAAGRDEPILNTLNRVLTPADIDWQVSITRESGDAKRFTKAALDSGVDAVAVYGGDGSLVEAASVLQHTDIPLVVLPGGTANAFAQEMRLPMQLANAAALLTDTTATIRKVDLGFVNNQPFLVGAGTGIIAQLLTGANREQKDRLGYFAYSFAALQSLVDPKPLTYELEIDGETVALQGVGCYVANSGNFGLAGVSLLPLVNVNDGLLDVVIFRKVDLAELTAVAAGMAATTVIPATDTFSTPLPHWQARQIKIEAEPPTNVTYDGESFGKTPVEVRVEPQALRVIVPAANVRRHSIPNSDVVD